MSVSLAAGEPGRMTLLSFPMPDPAENQPVDGNTVDAGDDEESDHEEPKKKRKKTVVRCRLHTWADIPYCGDRFDASIMKLPAEVMDRCFGYAQDLELRDYVGSAGTSRYFRHYLDDAFFKELHRKVTLPNPWRYSAVTNPEPESMNHPLLARPFFRVIPAWHVARDNKQNKKKKDSSSRRRSKKSCAPRGPRSLWSRSQFKAYKLAQVVDPATGSSSAIGHAASS
ncbi:hypothetical protein Q5752_005303 [Cryptotrichosporon argae]